MSAIIAAGVKAPLPREHGAWAMFVTPVIVGIGAAGTANVPAIVFAVAAFGLFLLRYPLVLAIKSRALNVRETAIRWSWIYGLGTAIAGSVLLVLTRSWALITLAILGGACLAIYLWQASRRAEMSAVGEWIGIAGLALGAPGGYLAAAGKLDGTALALYIVNLLYFGGTVFYVKFKVREQPRLARQAFTDWSKRLWAGRMPVVYQIAVLGIVGVMAAEGALPALAAFAFFLVLCKAVAGVVTTPPARLNLRRVGLIELAATIVFAALVLAAYA